MTARWFPAALVIGLAVTAARADEQPTRVFHIGIGFATLSGMRTRSRGQG